MKIVVCPDSFKGSLTAVEAAEAIKSGITDALPDAQVTSVPVGDGGEGTADALAAALADSHEIERMECDTLDPLGRAIRASYIICDGITAMIETAAASGLTFLSEGERDVMRASTAGTGILMHDAYRRGIRDFIICMGGSATCDGGLGAYEKFLPEEHPGVRIRLLCDVETPLCAPNGAVELFAPQKGAAPEQLPLLEKRLIDCASRYKTQYGIDISRKPYSGAAGGLAGMFMACFKAEALSGIGEVLQLIRFEERIADADMIITGEGRVDLTTLQGKAPKGILDAARAAGVPTVAIGGKVSDRESLIAAGFSNVVEATPSDILPDRNKAAEYLKNSVARFLRNI